MYLRNQCLVFYLIYVTVLSISAVRAENFQNVTDTKISNNRSNDAAGITQTVYGFLDFTTTIGNTVMVFSPQSLATSSEKSTSKETVIKEKPTESSISSTIEIKPSKTTSEPSTKLKSSKKDEKKTSTPKVDSKGEKKASKMHTTTKKPAPKTESTTKTSPKSKLTTKMVTKSSVKTEKPTTVTSKHSQTDSHVTVKSLNQTTGSTVTSSWTKNAETTEQTSPMNGLSSSGGERPKDEGPSTVKMVKKVELEPKWFANKSSADEGKSTGNAGKGREDADAAKPVQNVTDPVNVTEEPAIISSNGVLTPEYDFLSRQPSEVIDETFKVIDLKPSNKYKKPSQRTSTYEETQPLGLITSMTDTVIKDGVTTLLETNVIGTMVSGKYAQVLQSTSHIQKKIKPTSTGVRILKTQAPTISKKVPHLEATPYDYESTTIPLEGLFDQKASRKPTLGGSGAKKYKNKYKDDIKEDYGTTGGDEEVDVDYTASNTNPTSPSFTSPIPSKKITSKNNKSSPTGRSTFKYQNNRFNRPTTPELATVSVFSDTQASITPSYNQGNRRFTPSRKASTKPTTERNAKRFTKNQPNQPNQPNIILSSNVDNSNSVSSTTYKFKLNRPQGRWQYKTSPKPRITIRRQDENVDNTTVTPVQQFTPDIQLESKDQELSGGLFPIQHEDNAIVQELTTTIPAETLRVEISTPADFKDVYYEIATIKSPYSFQVGSVKNTRFITVTSTFEKSLVQPTELLTPRNEPLSENIFSTHNAYDKEPPLDSSIATLPPIGLAGDAETPPLETITESFSTTQLMLKTHILPVVRGGSDTTRYTLVQSYHVTRLVTATKTLPPMEVYQFVPSKTLNEFNTKLDEAGSEVHLELDFGDENDHDEDRPNMSKALFSDLDVTNVGSDFDISDVDRSRLLDQHQRTKKAHKVSTTTTEPSTTPALSQEQLQQLALLKLLNPNAVPNTVTSSKPVIKLETVYETHILPIFNGASTYFTTISRPTATLTKTEYELVTNTLPTPIQPSFNPFPSFQIASTPIVTQTMVTETNSKVLKLTFGAKTTYTTLFSTKVTPTVLTTYLTNSIPVQATNAVTFPGFFNAAPFQFSPQFPFLG